MSFVYHFIVGKSYDSKAKPRKFLCPVSIILYLFIGKMVSSVNLYN